MPMGYKRAGDLLIERAAAYFGEQPITVAWPASLKLLRFESAFIHTCWVEARRSAQRQFLAVRRVDRSTFST